MIEKGKISSFQSWIIMYPTVLATAILLVPAITAKFAGRDMWISPLFSALVGVLTLAVTWKLNRYYPRETIIEYSVHIIGRIPGKLLGFVYLFFYLHDTGIVIREYGEFVTGSFLSLTPIWVIMGSMVLVCAFNVRGGVEVMARSAQIFVPIVIFLFLWLVLLLIPDMDPHQAMPVMEHGIKPSFMGSVIPQGWFSEFLLLSFLFPYLSDRQKGLKWGMLSVIAITLTMIITNLTSLFLFGEITEKLTYPVMVAARYISLAEFFTHLESFVMAIWVGGMFVKISMFFYALVLGTAQWLGLSAYKSLALPIGLLLVITAIWLAPSLQEMVHFLGTDSPFYFIAVQTLIPMGLLFIAFIKMKLKNKRGSS